MSVSVYAANIVDRCVEPVIDIEATATWSTARASCALDALGLTEITEFPAAFAMPSDLDFEVALREAADGSQEGAVRSLRAIAREGRELGATHLCVA